MTAVDAVATILTICTFALYMFLPAFIAYKKGRRWGRWILPGLVFGPLTIPFIFWSGRTKKDSEKHILGESEKDSVKPETVIFNTATPSSTEIEVPQRVEEPKASNESSEEIKLLLKASRKWRRGTLIFTSTSVRFVLNSGNREIFNEELSSVKNVWIVLRSVEFEFTNKQKFNLDIKKKFVAELRNILIDLKLPQKGIWESVKDDFAEIDQKQKVAQEDRENAEIDAEIARNARYENFIQDKKHSVITPSIGQGSPKQQTGFWRKLGFLVFGKSDLRTQLLKIQKAENNLEYLDEGRTEFQKFRRLISDSQAIGADSEKTLFEIGSCSLIEVRKGARVTHRESSYSGSSSGGSVGVGRVRVGGSSSSGYSSSTSTSYPAPDILQVIDNGRFIFTNKKVSFIGSMFTKTTPLLKIVDYQSSTLQTLFAPATGSKVWICEFPRIEWQWLCECLLGAAFGTDNRTLDVKAKTIYEDVHVLIESEFTRMGHEIDLMIEEYTENLYSREFELLELDDKYGALPSWAEQKSKIYAEIRYSE